MINTEQIPAGYWKDADGRLVHETLIKPIDRTRDQLVRELVAKAKGEAMALAKFKAAAFADIAAFVELSAEQYGVKLGGTKGNISLVSYDGAFKVVRQVQDAIVFDERLQVAKKLIDNCIQRWAEGGNVNIRALVNDAFQVNREGRINTSRVLGLRRLDIVDDEWARAMQAISDSVRTSGSSTYVRCYERVGNSDQYTPISLDVAAV